LYLTEVRQQPAGDTKFPEYDRAQWREVAREDHDGFSFVDYERVFRDKGNAST
jgi:dihydrofolate reductase